MQALLVTTAGGLAMLVGVIVLGHVGGSFLLSDLIANPPTGLAASVGLVLVLIGALSKSAIVPLHFWLPGAMAAPTPVSAVSICWPGCHRGSRRPPRGGRWSWSWVSRR
ncbi:putative monovalent cation/H+ antiporter subunit A [Mycobacteroides abscessus subsp. abscessus]|nr:putative monovalent cation/H+ antiporter subunit A [Mycobacteroides abscessus subsp. abscessus]